MAQMRIFTKKQCRITCDDQCVDKGKVRVSGFKTFRTLTFSYPNFFVP